MHSISLLTVTFERPANPGHSQKDIKLPDTIIAYMNEKSTKF